MFLLIAKEIAKHSLLELGIQDPKELQIYADNHIGRYGKKLYDLRRRLEIAWVDYSEGTMHVEEQTDVDIEQHADGIMRYATFNLVVLFWKIWTWIFLESRNSDWISRFRLSCGIEETMDQLLLA